MSNDNIEIEMAFDVDGALEMASSAQINFHSFIAAYPSLASHPFYRIALHQLALVIEKLGGEAAGEP